MNMNHIQKNILEGYNELLWDRYRNNQSCNVGVLAGKYQSMRDLLLLNYLVSQVGNTEHFTDQSSFNFIIHSIAKDAVQLQHLVLKRLVHYNLVHLIMKI